MNIELLHWNYFIALEKSVLNLSKYVEITEENYHVFSVELTQIFLAASSEVDVVSKELSKKENPDSNAKNINEYRELLLRSFPDLPSMEMKLPRFGISIKPWEAWSGEENPGWWQDHNSVKHSRADNYAKANLINVLSSMSGLFFLILLLNKDKGRIEPPPEIFIPPPEIGVVSPTIGGANAFFYKQS